MTAARRSTRAVAVAAVDDDNVALLTGIVAAGHDVRVFRGEGVVLGKIRSLLLSSKMNL